MEELLQDYIVRAMTGRKRWLTIKDKYSFDKSDTLVIFPSVNDELNNCALKALPEYLEKKYLKRALILHFGNLIADLKMNHIEYIHQSYDDVRNILYYYRVVQFEKNIVIISLDEPYGSGNQVGNNGIGIEDYVKNAIYV